MLRKLFTTIMTVAVVAMSFFTMSPVASAADANVKCIVNGTPFSFLCNLSSPSTTGGAKCPGTLVANLFKSGLTLALVVVLILAVAYVIKAAINFIRAEGDEKKVGAAKAAMISVLKGIGAMFIAILGIVIINVLFVSNDSGNSSISEAVDQIFKDLGICK